MTNPLLTLENIRSGAFPSDAHAVGFLLGEIEKLQKELAETRKGEVFSDRVAIHWQTKAAAYIERFELSADQLDEWIDNWRDHFEPGYTAIGDLREIAQSLRSTDEPGAQHTEPAGDSASEPTRQIPSPRGDIGGSGPPNGPALKSEEQLGYHCGKLRAECDDEYCPTHGRDIR